MIRPAVLLAVLLAGAVAHAQPAEPGEAEAEPEEGEDGEPDLGTAPEVPEVAPEPVILWSEWEVRPAPGAQLLEDDATVRALLAPEMETRHGLSQDARNELSEAIKALGYHLYDLKTEAVAGGGTKVVLYLAPRLLIRRVDIDVDQWSRLYVQDEILRRMRLRVGEVLEVDDETRAAQLNDEATRLTEFLQEEGFFEAAVTISVERSGVYGAILHVDASLGPDYYVGNVTIKPDGPLAIPRDEIRRVFDHCRLRVLGKCRWRSRFTRAQHQADIQELTEMYQRRGYPAARVRSDFDPRTSFDRATRTVDFTLRIDERRRLAVEFEGNDDGVFSDENLAAQLTFEDAASADELEVAASAEAIQRYYQQRGWFDAAVSWERERKRVDGVGGDKSFDLIRYRIDAGQPRRLKGLEIVGARAISEDEVRAALTTQVPPTSFRLIGGAVGAPTTEALAADVARITQLYRRRGYLDAQVRVRAAPTREGLASAATTAAVLGAERGAGDLYVRFTIDEGERTIVDQVAIEFVGPHTATEAEVVERLAVARGAPFVEDDLTAARQRLQEWYWHIGRPRAEVTVDVDFPTPRAAKVTYRIEEHQQLRIGKVVVRGNFRTCDWVIHEELGFDEGDLLTDTLYTRGVRRLRGTGLFSAVKVVPVNLENTRGETVNVLVQVEERNDVKYYVDFEAGYSDQKSSYFKIAPSLPNRFHNGISIDSGFTLGWDLLEWKRAFQAEEVSLRFPRWVMRRVMKVVDPDVELAAFRRIQDTERFGELTTINGTIAASRTWTRGTDTGRVDRAIAATVRFDLRIRDREEESVRLAGNNATFETTRVRNRASIVGVGLSWDQRVDAAGNLNPLAPQRGWKLEGNVGLAFRSRYLGQDNFLKIGGIGQWLRQLSGRVQLRVEGRYDQGIPLGGAVLLPEVERFFAGGDETVRGFEEDRLLTEVVEHPVPPFMGVTQVEVLPAGGNIRMLGSIDLQVRLAKVASLPVASAIFVDAGVITNAYSALDPEDIRPSAGIALARLLTPFGGLSLEWALPLLPEEHDPPLGRLHFLVALRY